MRARIDGDLHLLGDYVINNAAAWVFPEIANEKPEDRERALAEWERHVATFDTAILSLIGESDFPMMASRRHWTKSSNPLCGTAACNVRRFRSRKCSRRVSYPAAG
ncbi:hypothetical protein ACQKJ1_10925 [Methylorubrum rhodesianum]|uniref:hypothetical protein n=1 Tax=Alphaproteobacteria TaxID=28211 RepID=UPI001AD6A8D1|nr:hypothetical protein [Roseomonas mucosa]